VTSSLSQLRKLLAETFVNEQLHEFAFDEAACNIIIGTDWAAVSVDNRPKTGKVNTWERMRGL
jgi:hypothetical protein